VCHTLLPRRLVTKPVPNLGVLVVLWPVFPVSGAEVLTVQDRVLSVTCAVEVACSLPPRPGGGGTVASTLP